MAVYFIVRINLKIDELLDINEKVLKMKYLRKRIKIENEKNIKTTIKNSL